MRWCPGLFVVIAAGLLINEVLYDPDGPDSGREFVELFNAGPATVSLGDLRLWFVNGSDPGSPRLIWAGEPGLGLEPGAWFTLGGEEVVARDRTIEPGLQNGSEALRLEVGGVLVDAVAWGEEELGLGEGATAGAAPGRALGRVPDGRDTQDNSADFRPLPEPTPGSTNLARDRFDPVGWSATPVWREDPGPVDFRWRFIAAGWADTQRAEFVAGPSRVVLRAAVGDTVAVDLSLSAPGSLPALVLTPTDTLPVGPERLPVGVGALVFTEVQARPADGEPEWVELLARGPDPVGLQDWALRDAGGPAREIASTGRVWPGERLVLCADPDAFLARYPMVGAEVLKPGGGWPSLNDSGSDASAAADSLHLVAPDGVVADLVTWARPDLEERGRPLQRGRLVAGERSIWLPAASGPTPGLAAPDEERTWPGSGLRCDPDPFSPDGDGVGDLLEILLVGEGLVDGRVEILDLRGGTVTVLSATGDSTRLVARWDGRDRNGTEALVGAYVVAVEATEQGRIRRWRQVVGLGRRR